MIKCHCINNSYLKSCSYFLYQEGNNRSWLIDCGDFDRILSWLSENKRVLSGIILTHCHYDHIYGVNNVLKSFPGIPVYLSRYGGVKYAKDFKLNTSKYTPTPYIIETNNFIELNDGDLINIFEDVNVRAYKTDGHSPDSMSYEVCDYLFTGDAYIPSVDVITRLPGGDKLKANQNYEKIKNLLSTHSLFVMPGHYIESDEK